MGGRDEDLAKEGSFYASKPMSVGEGEKKKTNPIGGRLRFSNTCGPSASNTLRRGRLAGPYLKFGLPNIAWAEAARIEQLGRENGKAFGFKGLGRENISGRAVIANFWIRTNGT
jgi:hypothetical protein